ncbi:STAS-like domain-containing protein [Rhizobium leguminosarum]|uniref:STAS-like domain-containing protein n=2 Tax=Rhizobium TaxID=379 RepID=UPI001C93DC5B|nr:STAS-like domain-containing protein [Rhizobium leguminosarum]MBY5705708.1 STAS-like domain-containing protein [Rhizobium leguminosarum]
MWSEGNHLHFDGKMTSDFLPTIAALHNVIRKQGYSDVTLDFRKATYLSPEFMIPLVATCRNYRRENVQFDILMPEASAQARLLSNANWAHLIAPESYESKDQQNVKHMSARQFLTAGEHFTAVDDSMSVILSSIEGIDRTRTKALEWALNEITDNVLNHAESPIGGVMQVMTFPKLKRVDLFVCDTGISIPRSLRSSRYDITDDTSAVRMAIEEGVTRNKSTNQGNGLYGTYKCCEVSGGEFDIVTGSVFLRYRTNDLRVGRSPIPFTGTYVRASIRYDFERLLERALIFGGRPHDPSFDYIERTYHVDGDHVSFVVSKELNAFGSRDAGRTARTKIANLMDGGRSPVEFDFEGVRLISSSFADEVFGKLFEDLGAIRFTQLCRFKKVDSTVQGLIDRAIQQRIKG